MTAVGESVSPCDTNRPPTMAMPSGWRSSAPAPAPTANGRPPPMAAKVVIMIGRKRSRQASWIACRGLLPRSAPALGGEVVGIAGWLLERARQRLELAGVVDGEGRVLVGDLRDGADRHLHAVGAGDVDARQRR